MGMNRGLLELEKLEERAGVITDRGKPVVLLGNEIKTGDIAPDFEAIDMEQRVFYLSDLYKKVIVISAIPSIDAPIFSRQIQRFTDEARRVCPDVEILTISVDLPYALSRWARANNIEGLTMLSDYLYGDFGKRYGLLVKENHLLARAVFVIDKHNTVRYRQLLPDMNSVEPDYEVVLEAILSVENEIIKNEPGPQD
jgi:thiol peroxidase